MSPVQKSLTPLPSRSFARKSAWAVAIVFSDAEALRSLPQPRRVHFMRTVHARRVPCGITRGCRVLAEKRRRFAAEGRRLSDHPEHPGVEPEHARLAAATATTISTIIADHDEGRRRLGTLAMHPP